MGKCASGTIFTILTLLTIGLTFALFVFATVIYAKIKSYNQALLIGIIVCLCISCLMLIFGIYASCCGNDCVKGVLSILYIIYAFGIGALGIVLLIYQKKLPKYFSDAYYDGTLSNDTIDAIESAFKCSFPPRANKILEASNCLSKFEDYVEHYGLICGIALIALFVFLFLGVCFAIRIICKKDKHDDSNLAKSREQEQMNAPLTYGW